ncbi:MAG: hypothetical protein O9320_03740 [Magnetospirillum sp.]|nr:hypothetical protein [Magnetospirillum sp.]
MARTVNLEAEIERFLDALDEKSSTLREVVAATKSEVARSSFANYKKFSDVCGDFDSFCILIEYRLKRLPQGPARAQLGARFQAARVAHMSRQLKTSIELMGLVASVRELPLGAKDVFLRELRSIYALKNALSEPPFADGVAPETAHDIDLAEKILREIIERAPTMLELSLGIESGEATAAEA